jgi:mycofactocin precursor
LEDEGRGKAIEGTGKKEHSVKSGQMEKEEVNIFKTEEIQIEEMAIDGIWGVC